MGEGGGEGGRQTQITDTVTFVRVKEGGFQNAKIE